MNDDILGRKGRKGCFYLWPSLACDNFATWEYLHKWASRARRVQSYTMGLNPEQTASAQGIPLLNMPFSLAVHVINEHTGLAFWQWCRNTCKWGGGLGSMRNKGPLMRKAAGGAEQTEKHWKWWVFSKVFSGEVEVGFERLVLGKKTSFHLCAAHTWSLEAGAERGCSWSELIPPPWLQISRRVLAGKWVLVPLGQGR